METIREKLEQHDKALKNISATVAGDIKFRYALDKTITHIASLFGESENLSKKLYDKKFYDLRNAVNKEEKELTEVFAKKDENGAIIKDRSGNPIITDVDAYKFGLDSILENHREYFELQNGIDAKLKEHLAEKINFEVHGIREDNYPPLMTLEQEQYLKRIGFLI